MKHSVLVLSSALIALISSVYNSSVMALDPPSHDTLAYTHELKPIPQAYQLARATFLPEASKTDFKFSGNTSDGDYNFGNCDEYPLSSCPIGSRCEKCPFNSKKFRILFCNFPYILSAGVCVCPTSTPLIYPNDRCTKYCGDTCIQKSCTPTANQTNCTNGTQNCDNGCGQNTRKCCIACTHKITTKPANSSYTYSSCTDESGTKQIQSGWTCNTGYHEKNGSCEKDCITNPCSGYGLSSCPSGYTCSSCTKTATNCSTDGTFYKILGCPSGQLDLNNYWCGGALKCWLK